MVHERVIGGRHHATVRSEDAVELAQGRMPVLQVVQHQRCQNEVERVVGEWQRLREVAVVERDIRSEARQCDGQEFRALVEAGDVRTASQ